MLRAMSALHAVSGPAREVLLETLMCVAWADRTLTVEEREAAQAAALGLGLILPPDRSLTAPDRRPTPPEDLDISALAKRDLDLVFLCAAWMALADDVEHESETKVLERLSQRFELAPSRVEWLREAAARLRREQTPDLSWWRAFDRLVVQAAKALAEDE